MAQRKQRMAGSWTYVLTSDRARPVAEQTRFVLRPLTGAERERYMDEMSIAESENGTVLLHPRTRSATRHVAITHIERIDNFPVGEPAQPWPASAAERETYLEMLDDGAVFEIGNEIYLRSSLGSLAPGANGKMPTRAEDATVVGESSMPVPTSS
jgi:hypothetical protein